MPLDEISSGDPEQERRESVDYIVAKIGGQTKAEIEAALSANDLRFILEAVRGCFYDAMKKDKNLDGTNFDYNSTAVHFGRILRGMNIPAEDEERMKEMTNSEDEKEHAAGFFSLGCTGDLRHLPFLLGRIQQECANDSDIKGLDIHNACDVVKVIFELNPKSEEGAEIYEPLVFLLESQTIAPSAFEMICITFSEIAKINSQKKNIKKIAPRLEKILHYAYVAPSEDRGTVKGLAYIIETLGLIGYLTAAPIVEKFLGNSDSDIDIYAEEFLKSAASWNADRVNEKRKQNLAEKRGEEVFPPAPRAVCSALSESKNLKREVFDGAIVLKTLADKQAWLTVNDPNLALAALDRTLEKLGSKKGGLDNILFASIGKRSHEIDDNDRMYYADEILDALLQFVPRSSLKDDESLAEILARVKYGKGVILRYTKREASDLTLGNKCGDCTSRGSIHFADSVLWHVNPGYNILKMSKGGFVGKINITLGEFNNEKAIIVDALEFTPQAQEGKPKHDDAVECFHAAIGFLRELAEKENRALFAFTQSNSGGATDILEKEGKKVHVKKSSAHKVPVRLTVFQKDMERILGEAGHDGKVPKLFYQMLPEEKQDVEDSPPDRMDEKLPELEREIVNPAQRTDPAIGAAMSLRDFLDASKLILKNRELAEKITALFRLPAGAAVSPRFLYEKLEKLYAVQAMDIGVLQRSVLVDSRNFVRL